YIADEPIADHDIDGGAGAAAGEDVPSLDIPDEVDLDLLEQPVRLLDGGVPLLGFLANAEESDRRIGAAEDVLGVDGAEPSELHQLLGGAVDVGPGVEDDDGVPGGWEDGGNGGPGEAVVELEEDDRGGHLGAGVAGRDEGVGAPGGVQLEPDDHRAVGLSANRRGGPFRHLDDIGGIDDGDAVVEGTKGIAIAVELRVELGGDDVAAA